MTLAQPLVGQHNLRIGEGMVPDTLNGAPAANAGFLVLKKDPAGYTLQWQKKGGQPTATYISGGQWKTRKGSGTNTPLTGVTVTKTADGYMFKAGASHLSGGEGNAGPNDLNLGWQELKPPTGSCTKTSHLCGNFTLAKQGGANELVDWAQSWI